MFNRKSREIRALRAENETFKTENETLKTEIVTLRTTDQLTGLGNLAKLMIDLEREIKLSVRTGRDTAVLFIDVDNMHQLNVKHSYAKVDTFLKEVADSIRSPIRSTDLAYRRNGGDEFVVVLHEPTFGYEARTIDAITRAIAQSPLLSENSVSVTIGSASLWKLTGHRAIPMGAESLGQALLTAAAVDMMSRKKSTGLDEMPNRRE